MREEAGNSWREEVAKMDGSWRREEVGKGDGSSKREGHTVAALLSCGEGSDVRIMAHISN